LRTKKKGDGLGSSGETVGKTLMMLHTDHPHMKARERETDTDTDTDTDDRKLHVRNCKMSGF